MYKLQPTYNYFQWLPPLTHKVATKLYRHPLIRRHDYQWHAVAISYHHRHIAIRFVMNAMGAIKSHQLYHEVGYGSKVVTCILDEFNLYDLISTLS